jgi:hypothetical protein
MQNKSYRVSKETPTVVNEPAVAYRRTIVKASSSDEWNPNVPFHGTEEEWWEHFHRIEKGEFMTIEEADKEFEIWRKKLLASIGYNSLRIKYS